LVLIVGALLFSYALSVEWAFRGLEQMGPVGKSRIINSLIYLVTLVVLVRDQSDLLIVGACLVAGDIISVFYLARAYQKRVGPIRLRLSVERWRALLQESWPLGVAFAMSTVYFYADFILLRALRDESAVGLYSAAGRLMTIFFTLSIIYVSAVFPRISQLSEESPQELGRFLTQAARAALVVILPAGLLATFLAQPIIQTLYGAAYLGAVRAFQILVWSLAVFVLGHLLSYSLVGQDRQHLYLLILGLGALVNVVANLWWIVPFGIVGAASAKLFSQGLVFVLSYWVLHKSLGLSLAGEIIRTVAAASVMGLVMSALLTWPTPVVVVVGLLLYFGALVAVQGITRADIRQFGAILSAR
jgi:O-antigen/teichoic acid export membrane protein